MCINGAGGKLAESVFLLSVFFPSFRHQHEVLEKDVPDLRPVTATERWFSHARAQPT